MANNPMIKTNTCPNYRKFDEDFKRQAVANWLASGKSHCSGAARS